MGRVDHPHGPDLAGLAPQGHHPVRQIDGLVNVMGDKENRLAGLAADADQLVLQVLAGRDIQRAEGLVHEQDGGVHGQRPGEGHPLPLAARQLIRPTIRQLLQPHQLERGQSAHPPLGAGCAGLLQPEGHIGQHAPPGQQARVLKDKGQRRMGGGVGLDGHVPRRGLGQGHQHPQQGRLAHPRGAHEGDELAPRDVEVERAQHIRAPPVLLEGEAEALDGDGGIGGRHGFHRISLDWAKTKPASMKP